MTGLRLFVAFTVLLFAILVYAVAFAACTTHTVYGPDGKPTLCTTCCSNGTCETYCF